MRATTTREATAGAVGVLVEGLVVRRCPEGHGGEVVAGDHRAAVRAAVAEGLPTAGRGWLGLGADRCAGCGERLTMPARRTRQSVTAVFDDDAPPATITFDLPRTRCPACAVDQVPAAHAAEVTAALAAALG